MITIYDFPHGARGLRSTWLCEEMALPHTFVPVGFPPDSNYRKLNPFGTLPFLQDDGVAISESVAMLFYIAQKYGPTETLPPIDDARFAKVLQFTLLGEASLSAPMNPLLAVRFGAPDDQKRNWSAVGIESRLKTTIGHLADALGDREFLVGPSLTLADISVSTALRIWSRGVGQDLPATLQAYCERLSNRPACKRAMAAHA